jgi:AAHS family 3-hydroxyphenylpropionic acid transporter
LALCFLAAILEGLDLQSTGLAAPRLGPWLHISKPVLGAVFSIGSLGLLAGALLGGWLADRIGRKRVLMGAVLMFGLFSLLTALVRNMPQLLAARLLTGAGIGAGLPMLIALTAEAVAPRYRSRAVAVFYAGAPLGSTIAALTNNLAAGADGWRPDIFDLMRYRGAA